MLRQLINWRLFLLGSSNNSCLGRIWISSTSLSGLSRLYKRRPLSERHFRKEHSSVRLCVGWDDEELPRFWRFCRGTLRTLPFTCTFHQMLLVLLSLGPSKLRYIAYLCMPWFRHRWEVYRFHRVCSHYNWKASLWVCCKKQSRF